MAEVAPRESIMSLTTGTPEKRKTRRDTEMELDALEEESLSCLKWPENAETVEEPGCLWRSESVSDTEKHVEMEDCERGRLHNENEEKPNLKRRQNSLDASVLDGEGSLKKLKISPESQDEQVTA